MSVIILQGLRYFYKEEFGRHYKSSFFDLFFTLITPKYNSYKNEYDVLGITKDTWEFYAENDVLYHERALGKIKDEKEIIKKIVALMPFHVTEQQQREILILRQNRMKGATMSDR